MNLLKKKKLLQNRRWRIRKKIIGSNTRPRISVSFTNKNIHAQCIDDSSAHTLSAVSTNENELKGILPNLVGSEKVGTIFGKRLSDKGITSIVFDRSGKKYHGCVKAFADSLRKQGLKF